MDEATMQIGLLMEAAQAQQKMADASLRRLRTASPRTWKKIRLEPDAGMGQ
ncbi:MAG TPA: hypothetical protein VMT29_15430 [Steroidobacteraceae bacterium]|nr:hypothetical protein [Steroidobacteraceae bacterium]